MAQQPGFVDEPLTEADKQKVTFVDEPIQAATEPNTVGTFVSHAAQQLNPVPAGQLIPFPKALGGGGWDAPLQAGKHLLEAQGAVGERMVKSFKDGDYVSAAAHALHWLMPVIGPVLDQAGIELQQGHTAAGLGDTAGIAAAVAGPAVIRQGVSALAATKPAQAVAEAADAAATGRVVDVIKPTVGANKVRFGRMAEDVAPSVVRETTGITRNAISESIAGKLEDATAALDEAADARLNAKTFPTRPVLDALQAAKDKLTASAVEGSEFHPQTGVNRPALGKDVVPAPSAARVAQLDQAIQDVKALGPVARYEALRRIRAAYDGPAKAVYAPSVTQDFLAKQGEKLGAADVTGALRNYLAKLDPVTAKANADYSLWKKASDVVTAAEETDRARPTVGRTMLARGLAAAAGGASGGGLGAAVGAIIGPSLERLAMGVSPAIKILAARQFASLADAIRAGQSTRAQALIRSIQALAPSGIATRDLALTAGAPQAQEASPNTPAVGPIGQ